MTEQQQRTVDTLSRTHGKPSAIWEESTQDDGLVKIEWDRGSYLTNRSLIVAPGGATLAWIMVEP